MGMLREGWLEGIGRLIEGWVKVRIVLGWVIDAWKSDQFIGRRQESTIYQSNSWNSIQQIVFLHLQKKGECGVGGKE